VGSVFTLGSRIKVVTSIVGNRDLIRDKQVTEGADFIAFTDQYSKTWEVREPYDGFKEPIMNAKIHKILIHKFIDTDISVWLDGNMSLEVPVEKVVNWLGDYDMVAFPHPTRHCSYEEIEACIQLEKGNKEELEKQRDKYLSEGYPLQNGLAQCNILVRRHNKRTADFNERWWAEICVSSGRDQVSFPYVLNKSDIKFKYLRGKGYAEKHPYFFYDRIHHK